MIGRKALKFAISIGIAAVLLGAAKPDIEKRKWSRDYLVEESTPNLNIIEHLISQKSQRIKVKRDGKVVATIKLDKPVMVAQADKEERWGFFQFPSICRNDEGNLIVSWQMGEDSFKAFGSVGSGRMMSRNEGKSWEPLDQEYFYKASNGVELQTGDFLQVNTPASKDISTYATFPKAVCDTTSDKRVFYLESELPEDLRGAYLRRRYTSRKTSKRIHVSINDPGLLRYSQDGLMPILWLGPMKRLKDGSLVAGVYPGYYRNNNGQLQACGISFYTSTDEGQNWSIIGKIPYRTDSETENHLYDGSEGFNEPAFEILDDSTFFCVMRTGHFSPMYKTYSVNGGRNWSKPTSFASNGVRPRLLKLGNGVLVLSSGRPGVQVRFCLNGDGKVWTEPIDMLPFMDDRNNFPRGLSKWMTCGYTNMMAVGDNSFYLVYSDFAAKTKDGKQRKAIMFRKIEIIKK